MTSLKRKGDVLTASAADLKKPKKDASLTSFFGAPKAAHSTVSSAPSKISLHDAAEPATQKFDVQKWASSLSAEQKQLLKLEIDTLDSTWLSHLKDELVSREFLDLKRFLQKEIDSGKKIFPPLEDVYSWSRHTPLNTVKVIILGQDPYHGPNQAHGLCFSVRPPTPAPPSLVNIYKALKKDYPSFQPPPKNGGLLTPWAEQGILMLNTCLTVRAHEANSHNNRGWEKFTQKVIDTVCKMRTRGVVFLAWGSPAQKRCAKISNDRHVVLKSVHPSPLSAMRGWYDCGHFRKTNDWLTTRYGANEIINWNLNNPAPIAAPSIKGPVKATGSSQPKEAKEPARPEAELPEPKKANPVPPKTVDVDEFDGDDDADAIAALEELANSSVNGDLPAEQPNGTAETATQKDES